MPTGPLGSPADVGALLKARRRALGLDQAELAAQVGVSRLWVSQVEGGKPGAALGLVLRALAAVGVDLYARTPDDAQPDADQPEDRLAYRQAPARMFGLSEAAPPTYGAARDDAPDEDPVDIDAVVEAARRWRRA